MPITVAGTTITFNDGSTQSTNVLNAIAASSAGGVGTYAFLNKPRVGGNAGGGVSAGQTVAGSALRYSGGPPSGNSTLGSAPAGTWLCMGRMFNEYVSYSVETVYYPTLFVRIS